MNLSLWQSELINDNYDKELIDLRFVDNINLLGKISLSKILSMFKIFYKINKALIFNKIDLVYFNFSPVGPAFFRDFFYIMFIKLYRKKIVLHLHGKGISSQIYRFKCFIFFYRLVFKGTNIICLSDSLINDLKEVYKGVPFVVNNGIKSKNNIDIFENQNSVQLLFLSNVAKEKGIFDFIDSISLLSSNNFYGSIIGNTYDVSISEIEEYITKKKVQHKIKFLGPKYGAEKELYLSKDSILVFPTFYRNEAFPLVILEAMDHSLPIISTNEGAISTIIVDGLNGFIIDKHAPDQIACKIDYLLKNPSIRLDMGKCSKIRFSELYTYSIFEKNIFNVFKTILNK